MGTVRIGTSGWTYRHWRGRFYPADLPRSAELAYLSERFDTVELNRPFYSLLTPEAFARYRETTPPGFVFAVKGSRYITHRKRLLDVDAALANFFAQGILVLGEKLGPILWQLPPNPMDPERIVAFLEKLPADHAAAARLARHHDDRTTGRAATTARTTRRLRHVLEVRHESQLTPVVANACRAHGVALAISHSGSWPMAEETTAGFVYLRLHGAPHTYASEYDEKALSRLAGRIRAWSEGGEPADAQRVTDRRPPARKSRDVYVYFDNDHDARAPANAARLRELLGLPALPNPAVELGRDVAR